MIRPAHSLALFLAVAFASTATIAAPAKPKPGPDVLVVGDAWEPVADQFVPTKEKPVHYVLLGSIEHTLGAAWAGEPQPKKETLEAEVARVLAAQNYQRTKVGGPMPQLALIITWGSANLMVDDLQETSDTGETTTTSIAWNRREIAGLVGANKVYNKSISGADADAINDAARQDRLYLMVVAFDAQLLAKKQKKLVWRTRISIESRRTSLPESLTVMLDSAAPYFGRNTELPIFVDDNLRKKADVQIGTPVVVPPAGDAAKK